MKWHRWLVAGALSSLLAGAALGQQFSDQQLPGQQLTGQGEGEQASQIRQIQARVRAALALSAEQESLLRDLRDRLEDELYSVRLKVRDGEISPYEGRSQLREAMRAQRQARDGILSPAQRDLLERTRGYVRSLQTAVPQTLEPEPLETNLVVALELTELQQLHWQDLVARQRAELAALRELGEVPTAEDVRQLRHEHRLTFEALLTPLQREELRLLRRRWHETQAEEFGDFDMGWGLEEGAAPEAGSWDESWDEPSGDAE